MYLNACTNPILLPIPERIRQSYTIAREDKMGKSRKQKEKLQQKCSQTIPDVQHQLPVSDCQTPEKDA